MNDKDCHEVILPNGMQITLRREEEKDWREVEILTRRAFWQIWPDRIEKLRGIGADEHYLAYTLRTASEFIPELDIVAVYDEKIIGNVMYTTAYIEKPDGEKIMVINFGPLSVLPEYRKTGVGTAIMVYTIEKAKQLGFGAIFFFGHPEYYPRFGFSNAEKFGITTSWGVNFPAFMGMELIPGYLYGVTGKFHEAPLLSSVDAVKAREYDRTFETIPTEPVMRMFGHDHIPFLHRIMNLPDIVKSLHTVKTSLNEWENTYSMWLSDKYEKNFIIYSYEKPVGWMKLNGFDGDAVWISMLVILPEYQRKGFGCFAINCAEKFAADCGFEKTCIHTQSDNIKAQGCYVKCGYKAIEEYECTCGDGEKLIGYTFEKKLEN